MADKPATIDAYLATLSAEQRAALQALRQIIREAAPDAQEGFSYGLPAFLRDGPLVGFGAGKGHCAFYPMNGSSIEAHKAELAGYETSKGAVRFQPDKPLPAAFVRKLVAERIAENRAKRAARGGAKPGE